MPSVQSTPPKLWSVIGSLLVFLVAAPVATWWIVGDQSEVADPYYADYLVKPPDISATGEASAGLIALVLIVGVFVAALPRLRCLREWRPPFVAVLAAGALLGFAGRLFTAGVSGANIGAGLMMLFGGPTYIALLTFAVARWWQLSRQQPDKP